MFNVPNPDMTPENLADAFGKALRQHMLCNSCAHKEVCKLVDGEKKQCDHFLNACDYKTYGNIYDMFEPIFKWMKHHHPSGDVRFIVERNVAQMYLDYGVRAYSKKIKDLLTETPQTEV